jgi:hypothetical protein
MSFSYDPRPKNDMESIEVYRHVSNIEAFVDIIRTLGSRILGSENTGGVTVSSGGANELLPTGHPYFEPISVQDLRLSLYARRDLPENNNGNKFASLKRVARNGEPIPRKYKNSEPPIAIKKPLSKALLGVQLSYDLPAENVDVIFSELVSKISPDIKNGLFTLTLLPDLETKEGRMLSEQAIEAHRYAMGVSRRVAFASSDFIVGIGIGYLRKTPIDLDSQVNEFIREIKRQLPILGTIGVPRVS